MSKLTNLISNIRFILKHKLDDHEDQHKQFLAWTYQDELRIDKVFEQIERMQSDITRLNARHAIANASRNKPPMTIRDLFRTYRVPYSTVIAINELTREGITTVDQLITYTRSDLRKLDNVGTKTIDYIGLTLGKHGLKLKGSL